QPLSSRGRWPSFYVCPHTGLLREAPRGDNKRQAFDRRTRPEPQPVRVGFGKHRQLHLVAGRWHLVELRSIVPDVYGRRSAHDALLRRQTNELEALARSGGRLHAVRARPLTADEVARLPIPSGPPRPGLKLPNVVR